MIKGRWFFGVAAGIILGLLAIYPQLNLQKLRGEDFAGAFATCDLDEMAYASYLQALIDGRPRKNDPYTGRDASADNPQPESLFSIQFFPAYLVAIPARILGLSASRAMPILSFVAAFLTALALFWLIVSIIEDAFLAFSGTLVILVGGALIIGVGVIAGFHENGIAYPFFPFLRRYIPSLAFPFLFAFFACIWKGLHAEAGKKKAIYSIAACLTFAAMVFSYFYLWTSAAAILFALTFFVFLFRAENWRRDFYFLVTTGILCVLVLAPYALLLSDRDETMDKAQLLVFTRRPDLLRITEVVGYFILALTAFALWRRFTKLENRTAYFIAAFAFAPLLVFNQQILTARSLQPFHYEFYVINYIVLLALVLIFSIFWQRFFSQKRVISVTVFCVISVLAVFWGCLEAKETTAFWNQTNIRRDEAMPVNLYLREIAAGNIENAKQQTTLNLEALQADSQSTVAPQAVLWARHQHVFAGLKDWEENKSRYYQILYYSGFNADWLRRSLRGCRDIEACMALFGWDRFNARLSANARGLTWPEIEEEVNNFARFSQNFNRVNAQNSQLSYVIIYNESSNNLKNLDAWYQRKSEKNFGKYTLIEVELR